MIIKVKNQEAASKSKEIMSQAYLVAELTADFVGLAFNGKRRPSLQECFPAQFGDIITEDEQEENQKKATALYKEQMLDFANRFNARRRAKEGENN